MKKRLISHLIVLLAVLVLMTACCAAAEESSVPVTGGSNMSGAKQIYCGLVYESVGMTTEYDTFTSYYQFTAPADEICTISFEVEKHYTYYSKDSNHPTIWLIAAYDDQGKDISYQKSKYNTTSDSFQMKEFPCVIARLSFPVERGKTYFFMLANGYLDGSNGREYFRDPRGTYRFSVCMKGTHSTTQPYTYTLDKAPTCTENGIEIAVCEWCGATLDKHSVPALGHTKGQWRTEQVATCWEEGFNAVRCTTCNEILEKEILEMIPHTQGEYVRMVEPTCEETGLEQAFCEVCGQLLAERIIMPLGHVVNEWTVETEATCDQEGTEIQCCERCRIPVHRRTNMKLPHTLPDEWTLYTPATCTTEGLEVKKCTVCGEIVEQRALPATGHTPGAYETLQTPSCIITGMRLQECIDCHAMLGQESIPALGHQWTDWIITLQPTTESEGESTRFCTVCGETEVIKLKKSE